MSYATKISELAPGYDPRHVEAYMRLGHPTLNGLSPEQFAAEVRVSVRCIAAEGREVAEELAASFGL